ncbi:translation initiation factor IF-2 N-terminal domain-containing protein [Corynebacterium heidelbergense]|uniref:translation initiation factor IF-2 N-terminal domain-containing protein n=1 Tax=Corynebacterium heidelbergense TaxID=2055947 RepID=UPI001EE6A62B|nr:translation initiation factor IF-2 N-terminal domain-containing protein [Corynebacterium heidelbergense]
MATTATEHQGIDLDNLGAKVRVHALAKILGVSSAELIGVLGDNGYPGKKAASTLSKEDAAKIIDLMRPQSPEPAEKPGQKAQKDEAALGEEQSETTAPRKTKRKSTKKAAPKATKRAPKKAAKKQAPKKAEKKTSEDQDADVPAKDEARSQTSGGPSAEPEDVAQSVKTGEPRADVETGEPRPDAPMEATEETTEEPTEQAAQEPEEKAADKSVEKATEEAADRATTTVTTPRRRVRRIVRRVGARSAQQQASTPSGRGNREPLPPVIGGAASRGGQEAEEDATHLHPAERDSADFATEPVRLKGSTRLESRRRWRAENKEETKIVSRSEFLARRESVHRVMVVRDSERSDRPGLTTQVGVVEDGMLVEHFVTSDKQQSMVGNIYLGRVQNVLASMEAAFIDIGTGRNAVLYAGEMNWRSPHLHSRNRRIDSALHSGDQILVQVIKDPLGHKGARLTNRISFAGRFLVYFPGGTTAGISRKLPEPERKRLKTILSHVIPGEGGAIIRTAAENAPEEQIGEDVQRLHDQWEEIEQQEAKLRAAKGAKPRTLYEEPNMLVKVVRDLFNEDFAELLVDGDKSWRIVDNYVRRMAPDLRDRVKRWDPHQHGGQDVFAAYDLDEQLQKALSRKVWLPSGGYLIFDRTEAMTVIDVNTGSFVGAGGNLEETVTQNNLEAAEEIVRQMRLRDIGGMIVVDFIDMVLQQNQDLVLRRLSECLGRDRTRHKVSEVTSLGLVQMTRKRLGTGLLETFTTTCQTCDGRGVIVHADPVEQDFTEPVRRDHGGRKERQQAKREQAKREEHSRRGEPSSDSSKADASEDRGGATVPGQREEQKDQRRGERKPRRRTVRTEDQKTDRPAVEQPAEAQASHGEDTVAEHKSGATAEAPAGTRRSRRRRRIVRRSVADIAAEALRTAREADPEEPSNEDYASPQNHPEQPERAGRETGQATQSGRAEQPPAASDHGDSGATGGTAGGSGAARRRRRRIIRSAPPATATETRPAGTRRGPAAKQNSASAGAQDAPRADESGGAREKKGGGNGGGRRTYSQAKAEFDNSPRRKRKTRGNSRSDVPPRPEDFNASADASKGNQNPERAPRPGAETTTPQSGNRSRRARRGRRTVRQG